MCKKLLFVLGFMFTVMTVHAISICKGTGTGGTSGGTYGGGEWTGSADFPVDKTFIMTVKTPTDKTFSFEISASGNYSVDWGDGTAVQTITKSDTALTTYSHTYPVASTNYTAKLAGLATQYSSDENTGAISFSGANPSANLVGIAGNLGYIFPILNTSSTGKPRFYRTFYYCGNIKSTIPENLFAGLNGSPTTNMFSSTFFGCSGLTGAIPGNLFSGISGAPASGMFWGTFDGCAKLTGSIPSTLFAGISGAPANEMFIYTFAACRGLTGAIPGNLFAGIKGAPASSMFQSTFNSCSGLTGAIPPGLFAGIIGAPAPYMFSGTFVYCDGFTSIPVGLFGNLSGAAASNMFSYTFYSDTGLKGQSALMPDGVTHLYEVWPSATTTQVGAMYNGANGLADYASIPANWK
jgi:hypothetical protein